MDAELSVEVADDIDGSAGEEAVRRRLSGYGVALEVVDLGGSDDTLPMLSTTS